MAGWGCVSESTSPCPTGLPLPALSPESPAVGPLSPDPGLHLPSHFLLAPTPWSLSLTAERAFWPDVPPRESWVSQQQGWILVLDSDGPSPPTRRPSRRASPGGAPTIILVSEARGSGLSRPFLPSLGLAQVVESHAHSAQPFITDEEAAQRGQAGQDRGLTPGSWSRAVCVLREISLFLSLLPRHTYP